MRMPSRRAFLKNSLAMLPTATLASSAFGDEGKAVTHAESKFKFSLAAYSYRQLLSGESPKLTLFDFVDDCAKFGLEGTELTSYYFPKQLSNDYIARLRRRCFRQGLDVSGTAIGNDFGFPAGLCVWR